MVIALADTGNRHHIGIGISLHTLLLTTTRYFQNKDLVANSTRDLLFYGIEIIVRDRPIATTVQPTALLGICFI